MREVLTTCAALITSMCCVGFHGDRQSIISTPYCVRQFSQGPGIGVFDGMILRPSIKFEIYRGGGSIGISSFNSEKNNKSSGLYFNSVSGPLLTFTAYAFQTLIRLIL